MYTYTEQDHMLRSPSMNFELRELYFSKKRATFKNQSVERKMRSEFDTEEDYLINLYRPYWDLDHVRVDWEIYPTLNTIHWIAWKKIQTIKKAKVLKEREELPEKTY